MEEVDVKDYYKTTKLTVSIPLFLLKRLEIVKNFPKWKGNKSRVVVEALERFLEAQQ